MVLSTINIIDTILQLTQDRKNFIKTDRVGEIHVPHCLIIPAEGGQTLRWWNESKCAGFCLLVIRPRTAEKLAFPLHDAIA